MLKYIPSGADETTPSRSEYFSWINNTNEGATEAMTLANLNFFAFLRETFSMQLDIYAFDAGAIDGKGFYGRTDSPRFRKQFPHGLKPARVSAYGAVRMASVLLMKRRRAVLIRWLSSAGNFISHYSNSTRSAVRFDRKKKNTLSA